MCDHLNESYIHTTDCAVQGGSEFQAECADETREYDHSNESY